MGTNQVFQFLGEIYIYKYNIYLYIYTMEKKLV